MGEATTNLSRSSVGEDLNNACCSQAPTRIPTQEGFKTTNKKIPVNTKDCCVKVKKLDGRKLLPMAFGYSEEEFEFLFCNKLNMTYSDDPNDADYNPDEDRKYKR